MSSVALTALALGLYLVAVVCYSAGLFLRAPAAPTQGGSVADWSRFGRPLLFAGIVAQFAAIGAWCIQTRMTPFASEYGTLAVTAWTIALALAVLDIRNKWPAVGAVALLMACIAL